MTAYTATNAGYDQNIQHRDTEMIDMTNFVGQDMPRKKPFDWCILSVLGYICCAPIGICAMYYAIRTNHGHDHNIEEYKIQKSVTKAKVLTILSIILGSLTLLGLIIYVVVMVNRISNLANQETRMFNSANDYSGKQWTPPPISYDG